MAKKPFDYKERSEAVWCTNCGIGIKKNVIARKTQSIKLCYRCHKMKHKAVGVKNEDA